MPGFGSNPFGQTAFGDPPVPTLTVSGCIPLIPSPNGQNWTLGITDNGELTTTPARQAGIPSPMKIASPSFSWLITADNNGAIVTTQFSLDSSPFYWTLRSLPSFLRYAISADDLGELQTQLFNVAANISATVPYPQDVTMSRWPDTIGLICYSCGNATVSLSADMSCWCCSCNSFVDVEDTN